MRSLNMKNIYIDIFAGCGGLSTGFFNAGWTGLFAVEKNVDAFSTLEHNLINQNNHFKWPDYIPQKAHDINDLIKNNTSDLMALRGKITLVTGGPPCQGFSMAGKRDKDDQRNTLVKSYIKFIKLVMPENIVFENVHGFTVHFKNKKGTKVYSSYVENALRKLGYKTHYEIIDMSEYGVPQKRKRFILIAMKKHTPKTVFKLLEENREQFLDKKNIKMKVTPWRGYIF